MNIHEAIVQELLKHMPGDTPGFQEIVTDIMALRATEPLTVTEAVLLYMSAPLVEDENL